MHKIASFLRVISTVICACVFSFTLNAYADTICPSNSTANGSSCECNSGYQKTNHQYSFTSNTKVSSTNKTHYTMLPSGYEYTVLLSGLESGQDTLITGSVALLNTGSGTVSLENTAGTNEGNKCWCRITYPFETNWKYSSSTSTDFETCTTKCISKINSSSVTGFYGAVNTGILMNGEICEASSGGGTTVTCNNGYENINGSCSPINYAINYYLNGGSNFSGAPVSYNITSSTINLGTPTRNNYSFAGWFNNSGFNGSAISQISNGSTGDKDLYAKWCQNCNASTGATCSLNITNSNCVYTTGCANGYTNLNGTGSATPSCEIEDYVIILNTDFPAYDGDTIIYYNIESDTITLPILTRIGYTFVGWYDNEYFNENPVTQIPNGSFGNKEYYAKWEKINIECNSGEYLIAGHETCSPCPDNHYCEAGVYTYSATEDQGNISCPTDYPYSEEGIGSADYCFANCVKQPYFTSTGKNYKYENQCNYIPVPGCPENYYMNENEQCLSCPEGKYSAGGYASECGCQVGYHILHTTTSEYYKSDKVVILSYTTPTITTSTISNWHLNIKPKTWQYDYADGSSVCRNKGGSTGKPWNPDNDPNISGTYCWCKMTAPFETQWLYSGMQNGTNCESVCANTCADRIKNNPSIRKAVFDDAYSFGGADYEIDVCVPNEYSVVYNANGGSAEEDMPEQSFVYDKAQNLSQNTYTKSRYEFNGWNTESDGSGDSYIDTENVINLTATENGIITLYAQWLRTPFVCASNKWLHIGNEQMCLLENVPQLPALGIQINGTPYYLQISNDTEKPMNENSSTKMHIYYNGAEYNIHDASID